MREIIFPSYSSMRARLVHVGIALVLSTVATHGFAATFLQQEHALISEAVKDDVYAVGERVTAEKTISGDLFAAGGIVELKGAVQEDAFAAGNTILVSGAVTGDLRLAGKTITISGNVNGDVIAAGVVVLIAETSVIRGDVIVMGGKLILRGTVRGNLRVMGDDVSVEGPVLGNLNAKAGTLMLANSIGGTSSIVAKDLILGGAATFAKDVHYWSRGDTDFGTKARGTVTKDAALMPDMDGGKAIVAFVLGVSLYAFLAGALVILLIVLITQKSLATAARKLSDAPWKAAFTGFLFFFLTPILIFFLMLTVIGIPLGLFALMFYVFSFFFAPMVTAVVLAKWFQIYQKWNMGKFMLFLLCLVTFIFLELLILIPIVGWIIKAALICMGFGAVLQFKWEIARKTL